MGAFQHLSIVPPETKILSFFVKRQGPFFRLPIGPVTHMELSLREIFLTILFMRLTNLTN